MEFKEKICGKNDHPQQYGKISLGWSSGRKVVEDVAKQIERKPLVFIMFVPDRVLYHALVSVRPNKNDLGLSSLWIARPNLRWRTVYGRGKLKQSFVLAVRSGSGFLPS